MIGKVPLGMDKPVERFQIEEMKGMYSPYTESSNFYVFTERNEKGGKILAHSFGNIRNPEVYEPILMVFVKAYHYFWGVPSVESYDIHPVCDGFAKNFGFVTDGM